MRQSQIRKTTRQDPTNQSLYEIRGLPTRAFS
jgi:hypothetical protein